MLRGGPKVATADQVLVVREAFRQLMALAGREVPAFVDILAGAPAVASPLYIQAALAAVLAAVGVTAADLWEMRSGQIQTATSIPARRRRWRASRTCCSPICPGSPRAGVRPDLGGLSDR
jgi:hypothetical protein